MSYKCPYMDVLPSLLILTRCGNFPRCCLFGCPYLHAKDSNGEEGNSLSAKYKCFLHNQETVEILGIIKVDAGLNHPCVRRILPIQIDEGGSQAP